MLNRLSILKSFLWASVGVLAAVTAVRFTRGLGAVTNLSDAAPWGLWIGFDVMAGVALAAGGFVMAATVYIFGLEKYRSFVRPAILTALLGYIAVAVGLLYDLGLPWHIWHPMIYWQHHSVLFEVATCVILYLTVLSLEFAPVILEHPFFGRPFFLKILKFLRTVTIPLVIAGIVLSTLHQSSLGSLFLIAPARLHPLWYSPIIYVFYFVSAVGLGLMTVVIEGLISRYFLGHEVKKDLLPGVGLAASIVLWFYVVLRLGDLAVRGQLALAFDGSWQSFIFLLEIGMAAILPAALLLIRRVRSSITGMGICASLTVLGMVGYRLNMSIVAFARPEGWGYFPSWEELAVSIGIVSTCILVFLFFAEHLKVYDEPVHVEDPKPSHDAATLHDLMPSRQASVRRYSLIFITSAAIALLFLPIGGAEPRQTPVSGPRMVEGYLLPHPEGDFHELEVLLPAGQSADNPSPVPLLAINGNRNDTVVLFDHAGHIERQGGDGSCGLCHHLDLPLDRASSCHECHRDMYEPTSLFNHTKHVAWLDGDESCGECHVDPDLPKTRATATACAECHRNPEGAGVNVPLPDPRWRDAPGYMTAMHNLCITCHTRYAREEPERFTDLFDRCDACHDADIARHLDELLPVRPRPGRTVTNGH